MSEKEVERVPLVTVITLVYNTGKYMPATLASIKNQTYSNIQHIIVDDCSSDDSAKIVEDWLAQNNYTAKFIVNKQNKGICENLNFLLQNFVKGKYCAFIGDDIMMPTKIEDDVKFMEARPELAMCYSKMIIFDTQKKEEIFQNIKSSNTPFEDYIDGENHLISTPTLFIRKDTYNEVGYYDERYICEDFDMILRITHRFPIGFRDEYTIKYIVHPGSMTVSKKVKLYDDVIKILKEKWGFLPNIKYYIRKRYVIAFCQLAWTDKRAAIKYMFKSWRFAFSKQFLAGLYHLVFNWN